MSKILNFLDALAGSDQQFSMQQRIFHCAILVTIVSFIPAVIFTMLTIQDTAAISLGLALYIILYSFIYFLARIKNQLQAAVIIFTFVTAMLLNIAWVIDHGAAGSSANFLFIVVTIIIFTAHKPIPMLCAVILNTLLIAIIDTHIRQYINWSMPINEHGQSTAIIFAMVYLSILALMYRGLIDKKLDNTLIDVVNDVSHEANTVNQNADDVAKTSDDLLSSTLQQITAIEELATATEQLNASAEQNSQQAEGAMDSVKNAETQLEVSRLNIDKLLTAIDIIKQSSSEIQSINNVINDISYQTNLLSLNAMIEASRSNENGGFKVVALEVRKLAERSAEAAQNINELLANNINAVQEGVQLSNTMREGFDETLELMKPLAINIQNVSEASYEQSVSIEQITQGLDNINRAVDENKLLSQASSNTSAELRNNASTLIKALINLNQLISTESKQVS